MRSRWLLRLYPARWRQRYGDEFATLLLTQRATPGLVIDILGGALDARLRPQSVPGSTHVEGASHMTTNLLKRCAAGGPTLTQREQILGAGLMIGTSLIGSLAYVAATARYGDTPLVDTLGAMIFPVALAVSMPFSYMKHHSTRTKVIVLLGMVAFMAFVSYLSAL
jgi:hypothetical protein